MPVFYTTLAVLWLIAVSCWRCCHCNLWSLTFSQNLHENPENIMPSNQMITIHTYKPYQTYSLCPDIHCFVSLALLSWKFSFKYVFSRVGKTLPTPPIIGALGHSTDYIVKQTKTTTIKIDLYSYSPVLCCHKRNSA